MDTWEHIRTLQLFRSFLATSCILSSLIAIVGYGVTLYIRQLHATATVCGLTCQHHRAFASQIGVLLTLIGIMGFCVSLVLSFVLSN
jgi:hypothetical protein